MTATAATVEAIYLAVRAGAPMQRVPEAAALAGFGLEGDRYATGLGYYARGHPCQVTLIEAEALERMHALCGVAVFAGEHRRNLVTRGLAHAALVGRRFAIGAAVLEYDRSRPPCGYLGRLTDPRLPRAMGEGPGCGANVLESGLIRAGDEIVLLPGRASRQRPRLP